MLKIGTLQFEVPPIVLAPMEDVSDPPFRHVCKLLGADLMYTEFISSEGLIRNAIKSNKKLDIYEEEKPIGIQLFGGDEEVMGLAARVAETTQPNLIDINFGCPVKKVVCKGAGAGVLKNLPLMQQITRSAVRSTSIPVTVKTRLGWDESSINIIEVAQRLQDEGIKALTIHARTRSQMYKGGADWTWIRRVKEHPYIQIPIFGNGDIDSPEKAARYLNHYGVDGIMIGRAAIGNPWIFRDVKHFLRTGERLPPPTIDEKIQIIKMHLTKSIEWKGEHIGIREMRRHYSNYLKNISHIKPLRRKLVESPHLAELMEILEDIRRQSEISPFPSEISTLHQPQIML